MSSQIVSSQIMPSETEVRSNRSDEALALEEDARLRDDIRLLGRILGDTVRDQEGPDVFDLVEHIRQTSIRLSLATTISCAARTWKPSSTACRRGNRPRSPPSAIFRILPTSPKIRTIFARCAVRPLRAGSRTTVGCRARLLAPVTAGFSGGELRAFFQDAVVSPVLTAHPTESSP